MSLEHTGAYRSIAAEQPTEPEPARVRPVAPQPTAWSRVMEAVGLVVLVLCLLAVMLWAML